MPKAPPGGPPAPSFQELCATESVFIYKALWRLGIPHRDLPDLTQDVLVAALVSWPEYDPRRPLRPWLLGITHRVAADYHRLARHCREELGTGETLDVADENIPIEDLLIQRELVERIRKLSGDLPADRQKVFVRHDLEGNLVPTIAESLNIPLNTAYSRLRLARREIRRRLEKQLRKTGRSGRFRLLAAQWWHNAWARLLGVLKHGRSVHSRRTLFGALPHPEVALRGPEQGLEILVRYAGPARIFNQLR